jgi:hypothetical protein
MKFILFLLIKKKMNVLSNIEMLEILKENNLKITGIFYKDQIPRNNKDGWTIVNLQDSSEGGGTHWVCYYKSEKPIALYFDSYGMVPPLDIEERLGKLYAYNGQQLQKLEETSCGYFVMACILCNRHGDINDFEDFLKTFTSIDAYFS